MDERQFRAFVSIAEIGRMDLAAKALGYSQPAISYQIKCLETSLRARLFSREPGGARLTSAGQMLLPSARAVIMLFDSIRAISTSPNQPRRPTVVPDVPSRERVPAHVHSAAVAHCSCKAS